MFLKGSCEIETGIMVWEYINRNSNFKLVGSITIYIMFPSKWLLNKSAQGYFSNDNICNAYVSAYVDDIYVFVFTGDRWLKTKRKKNLWLVTFPKGYLFGTLKQSIVVLNFFQSTFTKSSVLSYINLNIYFSCVYAIGNYTHPCLMELHQCIHNNFVHLFLFMTSIILSYL